jgi:hypothetical protein
MKKPLTFAIVALMLAGLACDLSFSFNSPTATTGPVATAGPTSTADSPYDWPADSGACTLETSSATVLYDRPSASAQVFSEIGAGFSAVVDGRTVDGWVGFDPAMAQAANIGVFRLRWVHFDEVSLSGDCVNVPQLGWVSQPDLCYFMPMESVNVYASTDTSATVIATLQVEDFASISGYTNNGWAQIDLGAGNTGLSGSGWVEQASLNMNGGTCDELPEVSP